ncbi:hypothetical protein Spb1_04010 [Planctopirus ephydatiae]|uniref:Uncharacterized protein n=1 Tax=Planctopirus ephydatiae TaxID=2528019 RepID=A0A518GIX7_9PLAN|nr:hypothetical protein Spb1_04010 [Planctopirus ephydatiae]
MLTPEDDVGVLPDKQITDFPDRKSSARPNTILDQSIVI